MMESKSDVDLPLRTVGNIKTERFVQSPADFLIAAFNEYAECRKSNIVRGVETPAEACLMVEKMEPMETYKDSKARLQELKNEKLRRSLNGVPSMLIGAALIFFAAKIGLPNGYELGNQAVGFVGMLLFIYGWWQNTDV